MTVHLSTLSSTGTEGTPTGSGARYTSMVSWEAAAQGNHGAGDQTILECYKGTTTVTNWDADGTHVASVDINTWSNLTQTDNITIRAAAGNAHGGVLGAGFKVRSSGGTMFRLYVPWVTMEDIEIQNDSTFSTLQCRDATGGGYFFNRIIATSNQTNGGTIDNSAYNNYVETRNSLYLVNGEGRGIYLKGGPPNKVLNCTILGLSVPLGSFGFDSQQTNLVDTLISNCVTVGFDSGDMREGGRWTNPSNASNATGDSTAAGSDPVTGVVLTDGVDFVAPSTEDYNAQSGGKLDGVGADLSGDFTDDITGATRTQWDIGAYGIISSGSFDDTNAFTITISSGVVAPVLSLPTTTGVFDDRATIGCTTDTAGGTLYWMVSTNATELAATIKAGGGASSGNFTPTSGANTVQATGLSGNTTYYHHWVQDNGADSNVLNSNSFLTETAIVFTGNITNITGSVGTPISPFNAASQFSGTMTPFTYTEIGTWPSWATLNTNTGVISGTPDAEGTTSNCQVTGTDADSNQDISNAFSFIISNNAPTVDAGGPYSGNARTPIALDGTVTPGSDPSPVITWSIDDGPDNDPAQFNDTSAIDAVFTPSTVGTYSLRLSADPNDGPAVSSIASLTSDQWQPTVDAGGSYSGTVNNAVQLNSTITPGSDPNPAILWTEPSGLGGTFSNATIEDPTFTPTAEGTYTLQITLNPNDSAIDVSDTAPLQSNPVPQPGDTFNTEVVYGTLPASGSQDYVVSGFGQPQAGIFFCGPANTDSPAASVSDAVYSIGFIDQNGVQKSVGIKVAEDPSLTLSTRAHSTTDTVIHPGDSISALDSRASTSMITDGIRMTRNEGTDLRQFSGWLFNGLVGSEVIERTLAELSAPINTSVRPDLVFVICADFDLDKKGSNEARMSFGFGTDTKMYGFTYNGSQGIGSEALNSFRLDTTYVAYFTDEQTGSVDYGMYLNGFTDTSFSLPTLFGPADTSNRVFMLVLEFEDPTVADWGRSTTNNEGLGPWKTTTPWKPKTGMTMMGDSLAGVDGTYKSGTAALNTWLFSGTTASSHSWNAAQRAGDQGYVDTSSLSESQLPVRMLQWDQTGGTAVTGWKADSITPESDGFTWNLVESAATVGNQGVYLAFKDSASANNVFLGSTPIEDVRIGSAEVKIYLGSTPIGG